jgi:hypothetical protein
MDLDQMVAALDIHIVGMALGVAMLPASQIGRHMGRRVRGMDGIKSSKFDDASIALLGLLLAFSFGTSIAKHDQRQLAMVADANAIGDFYACATLLKDPSRTKLQTVIRQYAQLRLDLARGRARDVEEALPEFGRMHDEMTTLVGEAVSDGAPIAILLANTLNSVTSNQASLLAAYRDRLPSSIVFLLLYMRDRRGLSDWPPAGRRGEYGRGWYGLLHSAGEHCGLRHTGFEPPRERSDPSKPGTD